MVSVRTGRSWMLAFAVAAALHASAPGQFVAQQISGNIPCPSNATTCTGACCDTTTCAITTSGACLAGTFMGVSTSCAPNVGPGGDPRVRPGGRASATGEGKGSSVGQRGGQTTIIDTRGPNPVTQPTASAFLDLTSASRP